MESEVSDGVEAGRQASDPGHVARRRAPNYTFGANRRRGFGESRRFWDCIALAHHTIINIIQGV